MPARFRGNEKEKNMALRPLLLHRERSFRSFLVRLPTNQWQVFRLPAHGSVDAVAAAGVIKKDKLLHRSRIHLAIFTQMNRCLSETVGLPARVQAVHVGLTLSDAGLGVQNGRNEKSEYGDQQNYQRQHGSIAHTADLPLLSPAIERPLHRPLQQREEDHDDDAEEKSVLVNVMKNVMAHFVAHDRLNFFRRTTAQQVVIERDS